MPTAADNQAAPGFSSSLRGVELDNAPLPALLRTEPAAAKSVRGAGASDDEEAPTPAEDLLSPAFVRVDRAFDLTGSTREATAAVSPLADLPDEQVVVLELVEDGGTAITTAGQLRERQERWLDSPGDTTHRGLAPARLFSRLYSLTFGDDGLQKEIERQLKKLVRERLKEALGEVVTINGSWLATKLLLKGIEDRLPCPPGLHRWRGGAIVDQAPLQADTPTLQADATKGLLVFVHGTGASTEGSFGELAAPASGVWPLLESAFGERIYGFEQRTFSVSPIDNALALAQSLPRGARLSVVSHGGGGLVADLLCAERIDDALIDAYRYQPGKTTQLTAQRDAVAAEQQERLRQLRGVLAEKALRIERYVRVACPARGSLLLGDNLDIYLSILLSLLSSLPPLAGSPAVAILKRLVLEVVRRRLDPCLVPGLAALAPDAPLAALLAQLPPRKGLAMATIAGHREGGHPLQKLALLFSDTLFFQRCPNDLVVDIDAMQAGLALQAGARVCLERGASVSHFHYFARPFCSQALGRWLTDPQPLELGDFRPHASNTAERERASTRGTDAKEAPVAARGQGLPAAAPLRVSCHAIDLRYVNQPVMVGHYENDSIAAAEALIDRDIVDGELSRRNRLGVYAGAVGSSTVVLMTPSDRERGQGSCRGAVVIGLGKLGELCTMALTEAVRVGTLRYLLQLLDRGDSTGKRPVEVGLASLLIGQNSTSDIQIEDSVTALVEGVLAANKQLAQTFPGVVLRVGRLQLLEVYLDTAITAARSLSSLETRLNRDGLRRVISERELGFGKGWRHRLDAAQETGYWPRLLVTNGEPAGSGAQGGRRGGGLACDSPTS